MLRRPLINRSTLPGRAVRAAVPYGLIALAVGAARLTEAVASREFRILLGASLLATAGALLVAWFQYDRACFEADEWIAHHAGPQPPVEVVEQREAALVAPGNRRNVSRSLRSILEECDGPPALSARAPANRAGVRAHRDELRRLAEAIGDVQHPVSPRFAAQARLLVTCAGSPVYGRGGRRVSELGETLARLRYELDRAA